jgi:copper/silver efflux system protein
LLKPQSEWRKGMTKDKLIAEMDKKLQIPGVTNGWTQPIINRINMLSTGIRTDVGIKVYGQNLDTIHNISLQIEEALKGIEGLEDLYTEQLAGGKYLDIVVKREEMGRYGLNIEEVNILIESALGGMILSNTVEGRERFGINLRLAQDFRNDLYEIERLPIQTDQYGVIPLSAVADIQFSEGPPMINSENGMLRGTVLFNIRGRDMGSVVKDAKNKIEELFSTMPQGYYLNWSGQYENQIRAQNRLKLIIPIVLIIICFILYFTFRSLKEALIVLTSIPIALIGGVYSLHFFEVNFSIAAAVGFIALFGVAIETGILMIVYMNESIARTIEEKKSKKLENDDIAGAVYEGAVMRVRPKLMTVMADMIGLTPILLATGAGSDVMKPIAIPFVFGLITSTLFVLIVLPVVYQMVKENELRKKGKVALLKINE